MSQTESILHHLRHIGPISSIQALELYGCFRLAARIKDIRQMGFDVVTEKVEQDGKTFARYRLATGKAEQLLMAM